MWVYSSIGFFSIVQHRDLVGVLVVRARVFKDLLRLKKLASLSGDMIETSQADYRYRIFVDSPVERFRIFEVLDESITYPNFKGSVDQIFPDRSLMHHAIHAITEKAAEGTLEHLEINGVPFWGLHRLHGRSRVVSTPCPGEGPGDLMTHYGELCERSRGEYPPKTEEPPHGKKKAGRRKRRS